MKKKLLIAGGSGLIGTALQKEAIKHDWEVTLLSRSPGQRRISWNPEDQTIDLTNKIHFDAIINLAGSPVNQSWTTNNMTSIYQSRMKSTRTLMDYLHDGRLKTSVYIGASAVGIYGNRNNEEITEETIIPETNDWFVNTVIDWEKEHCRIADLGIRTVIPRIGIVLSQEGGALKEILKTSHFGFLTYFGDGHQIWPWIHIDDLVRMFFYFIKEPDINGRFLTTGPGPASNKVITRTISTYLKPWKPVIGIPRFILSLILGKMHRVLFDSCHAIPKKILQHGFQFTYPSIHDAIRDLTGKLRR